MRTIDRRTRLSRRRFLQAAGAGTAGVIAAVNGALVIGTGGAWALEVKTLQPSVMATLIQMARDIYPHDHLGDSYYAKAMIIYDQAADESTDLKRLLNEGVDSLDSAARQKHGGGYLSVDWEEDRVALLQEIEATPFFQTIRSGLITGLYNQPEVWAKFGYEGPSADKGGYISRGFDDIDWLDA